MRPYQRRADPELSPHFAKDAAEEDFLERLNAVLAPHEEAVYRDLGSDAGPCAGSIVHAACPRRWRTPLLARAASATIPRMSGMVATCDGRTTAPKEVSRCAV